jgi:hypothetical protein
MSSPALVHFVRDVLGCGCPDEVLQSTSVEHRPGAGGEPAITRMDVGGRLLIYIVELAGSQRSDIVIPAALEAGLADRDRHGFNRFRLVLTTADPTAIEPAARAAFDACNLPDDRVHLHVAGSSDVRAINRFPYLQISAPG